MFDETQLNPIMTAIERLGPDARYTLKEWFYGQDWPEELEDYRVAERLRNIRRVTFPSRNTWKKKPLAALATSTSTV